MLSSAFLEALPRLPKRCAFWRRERGSNFEASRLEATVSIDNQVSGVRRTLKLFGKRVQSFADVVIDGKARSGVNGHELLSIVVPYSLLDVKGKNDPRLPAEVITDAAVAAAIPDKVVEVRNACKSMVDVYIISLSRLFDAAIVGGGTASTEVAHVRQNESSTATNREHSGPETAFHERFYAVTKHARLRPGERLKIVVQLKGKKIAACRSVLLRHRYLRDRLLIISKPRGFWEFRQVSVSVVFTCGETLGANVFPRMSTFNRPYEGLISMVFSVSSMFSDACCKVLQGYTRGGTVTWTPDHIRRYLKTWKAFDENERVAELGDNHSRDSLAGRHVSPVRADAHGPLSGVPRVYGVVGRVLHDIFSGAYAHRGSRNSILANVFDAISLESEVDSASWEQHGSTVGVVGTRGDEGRHSDALRRNRNRESTFRHGGRCGSFRDLLARLRLAAAGGDLLAPLDALGSQECALLGTMLCWVGGILAHGVKVFKPVCVALEIVLRCLTPVLRQKSYSDLASSVSELSSVVLDSEYANVLHQGLWLCVEMLSFAHVCTAPATSGRSKQKRSRDHSEADAGIVTKAFMDMLLLSQRLFMPFDHFLSGFVGKERLKFIRDLTGRVMQQHAMICRLL